MHGNFNLSKVLVQRFFYKQADGGLAPASLFDDDNFDVKCVISYFLTNFEPWSVEALMKQFQEDEEAFKEIMKMDVLKMDRKDFLRIAKIQDLQAFGNSIVEIMVGRGEEPMSTSERKKRKFNLSDIQAWKDTIDSERHGAAVHGNGHSMTLTGGISLDHIPIKWSNVSSRIFEIIQLCLGPYGPNNSFHDLETSKVFQEITMIATQVYEDFFG